MTAICSQARNVRSFAARPCSLSASSLARAGIIKLKWRGQDTKSQDRRDEKATKVALGLDAQRNLARQLQTCSLCVISCAEQTVRELLHRSYEQPP